MDPTIVTKGAFTVAGCLYRGKNEHGEIPRMWDEQFIPRMAELPFKGHTLYGAVRMSPECAPGEFEYLACGEVEPGAALPEGMVVWSIPARTYAVAPANDVPDLGRTFDALHAWVAQSPDYDAAAGVYLEVYPDTYPQDPTIQVHAPVKPKG